MKRVLIFSGTTEGRELAGALAREGIPCEVSVATAYGESVMEPCGGIAVRVGRLDGEQMEALLLQGDFFAVVDATHPYAVEVSENIRRSAERAGIPCLRLARVMEAPETYERVRYVPGHEECAGILAQTAGNILLATGAKNLAVYAVDGLRERLFVRVLPGTESIAACEELGIRGKQIIAMQGPFSEELDLALIRQFRISVLVTKESGSAGGFPEKLRAAERAGIAVLVIENPDRTGGQRQEEVKKELLRLWRETEGEARIAIVGIGMGNPGLLTAEAREEVADAQILFGARRMLDAIPYGRDAGKKPAERCEAYRPEELLSGIRSAVSRGLSRIALLFSGDTGFYSGAQQAAEALRRACREGSLRADIRIYAGISSVSYLAARTGRSWQDARIMSVHGRSAQEKGEPFSEVAAAVRAEGKVFLLLSCAEELRALGEALVRAGLEQARVTAGLALSYPDERILELTPGECMEREEKGLCACFIECPKQAAPRFAGALSAGMPDGAFLRGRVPMTKEEVRMVALGKLRLSGEVVFYDVGSGSGSVAAEAARLCGEHAVYAIEKREKALALMRQNLARLGAGQVHVVEGEAPECLAGLPAPTHAFVGGSGGRLGEIVRRLFAENERVRVVITAVSLETVAELRELLREPFAGDAEVIQLQVSRAAAAGEYHLMRAENPVWLVTLGGGNVWQQES